MTYKKAIATALILFVMIRDCNSIWSVTWPRSLREIFSQNFFIDLKSSPNLLNNFRININLAFSSDPNS